MRLPSRGSGSVGCLKMVQVAIAGVFGMDDTVTGVDDDKHGLG